jgi:hypothetical protein
MDFCQINFCEVEPGEEDGVLALLSRPLHRNGR